MPYLHLRLSGTPAPALCQEAARRLTALSSELLRKRREVTALTLETVSASHWWIGGEPITQPSFFLEIAITQGTNSPAEKAAFIEQAYAALEELLGPVHAASYVVIREVPAEAWGYEGRTQEARLLHGSG